jgi:hypothetical protein
MREDEEDIKISQRKKEPDCLGHCNYEYHHKFYRKPLESVSREKCNLICILKATPWMSCLEYVRGKCGKRLDLLVDNSKIQRVAWTKVIPTDLLRSGQI